MLGAGHGCCQLPLLQIRLDSKSDTEGYLPLPPSGSKGFMLGEILGLNAGLTRLELTLFLFLGLRASFGSFLPLVIEKAGLVGVDMASSIGLGLADMEAPGVLRGFNLGVFRADIREASPSPFRIAVSILDSPGLSSDASGRVRSSSIGGASWEPLTSGEGCIRMRDAGVAGVPFWLLRWAIMAGEAVEEVGFGGGRISDSIGSGDIESVSELSRVLGTSRPLADGRVSRASCMSSVTSLGGMREDTVAFRLLGLTIGDCRTRPLPFVRGAFLLLVLRRLLRPCSCGTRAGSPSMSISTSMGEWPVELPDVVCCDWWCTCCWLWAFKAGDVRGLK